MLHIEEIYLLIFIKVVTLFFLKQFFSKSNIYTELFFCLGYDLSTDFANHLFKINLKPFWTNFFLGTGIIWFLTKMYSFEKIISFLTKKNKNRFTILKLISLCIGINQLFTNIIIAIKYKSFQDIIPINLKPFYFSNLNQIANSIIPLIILIYGLIKYIKTDNIKKNNLAFNTINDFIRFGLLLKIFFDLVQAGSFKFIEKIINQKIVFHSIFYTSLSSWISLIFIYYMFKFLLEEQKYQTKYIDLGYFAYHENPEQLLIKLEDYYLEKMIYENSSIQETLMHNLKRSLSLKTNIKPEDILIYPINDDVFKPTNDHEYYLALFKESKIYDYITKYKYISKEYLYTHAFFNKTNNIMSFIAFLEKNHISFIGLWIKKNTQANIHNGIVIIKDNEQKKMVKSDLICIIKHIELIETIENLFLKTSNFIIQKTKEKYEKTKLEYLYKYQEEIFKELNELESNIKIHYIQEDKLKLNNSNDMIDKYHKIINENIYHSIFKNLELSNNNIYTKTIKKYQSTHLMHAIKTENKKNILIHMELPRIFPQRIDSSNHSTSCLPFTQIGKKINTLIKIEKYQYQSFKKEILELITNAGCTILTIEPKYFKVIEKIVEQTSTHYVCTIQNENKNILGFFDKQISIDNQSIFLTKYLKEEDTLMIKNINEYSQNDQRILSEYMLYKKDPFEKYVQNIPSKIILTIDEEDQTSIINQNILSIAKIKKLNDIYLEESYKEELLTLLIDSCLFFNNESIYTESEKIKIANDLYKYKDYLTLLDILLLSLNQEKDIASYFRYTFQEHESKKIEEITIKASSLGKDTLKNHKLMNQLIHHYNQNQIASLIGVNRSSISRYFKENKSEHES